MPEPAELVQEADRLRREVEQLTIEKRILELKVQKLQRQLWDKKSERMPVDDKQSVLFQEPSVAKAEAAPASWQSNGPMGRRGRPRVRSRWTRHCRGK